MEGRHIRAVFGSQTEWRNVEKSHLKINSIYSILTFDLMTNQFLHVSSSLSLHLLPDALLYHGYACCYISGMFFRKTMFFFQEMFFSSRNIFYFMKSLYYFQENVCLFCLSFEDRVLFCFLKSLSEKKIFFKSQQADAGKMKCFSEKKKMFLVKM